MSLCFLSGLSEGLNWKHTKPPLPQVDAGWVTPSTQNICEINPEDFCDQSLGTLDSTIFNGCLSRKTSQTLMCEWSLRFYMRGNRWQNFLTLPHWSLFWDVHITGLMLQRKYFGLSPQYHIFKILIMEFDYYIELSKMNLIHISMGRPLHIGIAVQ